MTIEDGTAAVRQLARTAHELAEEVRQAAARLGTSTGSVQWRSPAATQALAMADGQQDQWRTAAADLDDLAALLLAHGQAAAERAAVLDAAAQSARDLIAPGVEVVAPNNPLLN